MDLVKPEEHIDELESRRSDLVKFIQYLVRGQNWQKISETCQELIKIDSELKVWKLIKGK